jgi:hypothetical protein
MVRRLYAVRPVDLNFLLFSGVGLIIIDFQEDLSPQDVATRGPWCKITQRFNLAFEIHPLIWTFLPGTLPVPVKISEDIISHLVRSVRAKVDDLPSSWGVPPWPVRSKDTQTWEDQGLALVCDMRFLLYDVVTCDAVWFHG